METAHPRVVVAQGALEGVEKDGVHRFLGVPYAAPPIGDRRWRAPAPAMDWAGVREAKQFGAVAMQVVGGQPGIELAPQSEDCLYLNIWTCSLEADARRPVMVWIHGGGNLGGSGSEDWCDGSELARRGATVVTFNYRLGAFGFLAHPAIGANFAVLDQVEVLRWIRANISEFGGDPNNVTIFGESAGAVAVRTLLSCPHARGLFHRGVIQSAGFEAPAFTPAWSYERAVNAAEKLMDRLGTRDPDALRLVSSEDVTRASHEFSFVSPAPGQVHTPANLVWMPVPDGEIVIGGEFPGWPDDVPLLLGCVENEARYFIRPPGSAPRPGPPQADYTASLLEGMTRTLCGPSADVVLEHLHDAHDSFYEKLDRVFTSAIWTEPALATVERFAAMGRTFYYYHFARVSPGARSSGQLAQHSCEIRYVFGNLTRDGFYDEIDGEVAEFVQDAWFSFARDGVPRLRDGEAFAPYTRASPTMTWIGSSVESRPFEVTPIMAAIHERRRA
jgi:para-nitrobenzyl esterase